MCDEVVVVQQQAFFPSVELCLQEFDHYCVWLNNTIGPLSKRWIWGGSLCALLDKFTTLAGLLKRRLFSNMMRMLLLIMMMMVAVAILTTMMIVIVRA